MKRLLAICATGGCQFRNVLHNLENAVSVEFQATTEDVRYAYRLLLGREPDAEGLRFNLEAVERDSISTVELARRFLSSGERAYRIQPSGMLREIVIDGVKLYPWEGDHLIGDHLDSDLAYESNVLPDFLESLSSGDHFLDVGANVGLYSLLAAKRVGPAGTVYSVEPVAANLRSLCVGIQRNAFQNVSVFPLAASDKASVIPLLRMENSSNGIVDYNAGSSGAVDFVPTQRLDFILASIPRLDVVKIDIEGHEPFAWKGLRSLVERHRPRIFSEFSPVAIRNSSHVDADDYLADLFEFSVNGIEVLSRDGRHIHCQDAAAVMQEWRMANEAMGLAGELHLDLMVGTRR